MTVFTSEPLSQLKSTIYPFRQTLNVQWPYMENNNTLQHSINGNRRLGYNILSWNCRKGLIQAQDEDTPTFIDLKAFDSAREATHIGSH